MVAAMLDADLALNQPGMPPVGWRVVPGGVPVVVAAGAPGTAGAPDGPRSVTVGGASYGGAWLERFQPYGDTETVFSFRFGAEARADQALVVHTRYTDHEHRVALRVTREGVQLINRGEGEPDPLPVVFAAHPAATGVWYDVLARTVERDILVWIRRQDSPYTLEQATVFTPPLAFRVQGEPNAEVGQLLHTDSARLRVGFNTQPGQPILPGAIALRGLTVRALPCAEDTFPPATHTPCADVVISEIYVGLDEHCLAWDGLGICEEVVQGPWIELRNNTGQPVDLTGWALTDDFDFPAKAEFPGATTISGEYLVLSLASSPYEEINLHKGILALTCPGEGGGDKSAGANERKAASLASYDTSSVDDVNSAAFSNFSPGGARQVVLQPTPPTPRNSPAHQDAGRPILYEFSVARHTRQHIVRDFADPSHADVPLDQFEVHRWMVSASRMLQNFDGNYSYTSPQGVTTQHPDFGCRVILRTRGAMRVDWGHHLLLHVRNEDEMWRLWRSLEEDLHIMGTHYEAKGETYTQCRYNKGCHGHGCSEWDPDGGKIGVRFRNPNLTRSIVLYVGENPNVPSTSNPDSKFMPLVLAHELLHYVGFLWHIDEQTSVATGLLSKPADWDSNMLFVSEYAGAHAIARRGVDVGFLHKPCVCDALRRDAPPCPELTSFRAEDLCVGTP